MGERESVMGVGNPEQVGFGAEKKVYQHRDADKIVKLHNPEDAAGKFEVGRERYVKAEFYLTKILHLLLPKNIPDIHLVSHKYQGSVHEKKELGKEHKLLTDYKKRKHTNPIYTPEDTKADIGLSRDVDRSGIERDLKEFGINFDDGLINFGKDSEGNIIYVDSVLPWEPNHDSLPQKPFETWVNIDALKEGILSRLQADDQNQALQYLDRLEILIAEEKQRHDSLMK